MISLMCGISVTQQTGECDKKEADSQIRSDQISLSVLSDSLRPHESQHARPPCPSPTSGVHWDSRPSSQWCHPAISSSIDRETKLVVTSGYHFFLQGTFPTQDLNPHLLYWQADSLLEKESPGKRTDTYEDKYIYVKLNHFAVYLKLTEYCKSTIFQ